MRRNHHYFGYIFIWGIYLLWPFTSQATAVDNQLLVRWKQDPTAVEVVTTTDPDRSLARLQIDQRVDHVEPNYERSLQTLPNDEYFDRQYYLYQATDADIDAGKAWHTTTGDHTIVVAIIDTGVDLDHPDLINNIWLNSDEIAGNGIDDDGNGYIDDIHGWDFVDDDNDPNPTPTSTGYSKTVVVHGTHVAGIVGAEGNNAIGITGVNWNVQLMPIRVFSESGNSSTQHILQAIRYAYHNGADVLNMSYGGDSSSTFELEAILEAQAAGAVSIAAGGNEGRDLNQRPMYPACYTPVIGVAASTAADTLASFSNYGDDCINVIAPGDTIVSTVYYNPELGFSNQYGYLSGTSMATPVVSGVAALLLAYNSDVSVSTMKDIISHSTDAIGESVGRLNAKKAMQRLQKKQQLRAPVITAYRTKHQKIAIQKKTRSNDATPVFTWSRPASEQHIVGYYVYWGTKKANPVKRGTFITQRTFQPTGVHGSSTIYRLRVRSVDNNGKLSPVGSFKYISDTTVQRPVQLQPTILADAITVQWQAPEGEHVIGYQVYRSTSRQEHYTKMTKSLITDNYFLDITAQPGVQYYYKVRAIDDLHNRSTLSKAQSAQLSSQ